MIDSKKYDQSVRLSDAIRKVRNVNVLEWGAQKLCDDMFELKGSNEKLVDFLYALSEIVQNITGEIEDQLEEVERNL